MGVPRRHFPAASGCNAAAAVTPQYPPLNLMFTGRYHHHMKTSWQPPNKACNTGRQHTSTDLLLVCASNASVQSPFCTRLCKLYDPTQYLLPRQHCDWADVVCKYAATPTGHISHWQWRPKAWQLRKQAAQTSSLKQCLQHCSTTVSPAALGQGTAPLSHNACFKPQQMRNQVDSFNCQNYSDHQVRQQQALQSVP